MKQETILKTTPKRRMMTFLITNTFLLAIPALGMLFTSEIDWKLSDFVFMGGLLTATVLTIKLIIFKIKSIQWRFIVSIVILITFLLIWAELAVGLF